MLEFFFLLTSLTLFAVDQLAFCCTMVSATCTYLTSETLKECVALEDADSAVAAHFDGALLHSKSFFPYYMLVALEAGGPLRGLILLILAPILLFVSKFVSEALAIRILVFVTLAGLKLFEVLAVAKAVLPKFYLEDLHAHSYRALLCCNRRCVVTSHPKILIRDFLKTHLGADEVFGTEVQITKGGYCTGFLTEAGVLDEQRKADAVRLFFGDSSPDLGLGAGPAGHIFLSQCKNPFLVPPNIKVGPVPRDQYLTPLVFHDGRLVLRPTPLSSLAIFLWIPVGFVLALTRIFTGLSLPRELAYPVTSFLGLQLRVKGAPPLVQQSTEAARQQGTLFVCTHRTLADPTFLSMALRRKVRALSYSVSKISELIAPIKATRLTRNREEDTKIIQKLLTTEDLFVCPEGTTCREPFLLRFSPLFADLANRIVPVAINVRMSMFQGTTARGYKFLDGFFFLMNPRPSYEIILQEPISMADLRAEGKTSIEIANYVQKQLAGELGYQCTNFNRKDKYSLLAGHDGTFN